MKQADKKIILAGEDALALWRQGKDVWNKWVKEHPKANVDFSKVDFSIERKEKFIIDFAYFNFPSGNVFFNGATFGDGGVNFSGATFGDGNVNFSRATFGDGEYQFEKITSKGHADFSQINEIQRAKCLNFRGSIFEKTLDLSRNNLSCAVDLTNTKINNHVSLEGLKCEFQRKPIFFKKGFKKAKNPKDISRFRRLKQIAEENKDHERALAFHADEMRAKRWHETKWFELIVDYSFDFFSNYGRSFMRPFVSLFCIWIVFSGVYGWYSYYVKDYPYSWNTLEQSIIYSGSQMFQFIPSAKGALAKSEELLFGSTNIGYLYLVTFFQSILSIIFLFLIGLALRNRFRI